MAARGLTHVDIGALLASCTNAEVEALTDLVTCGGASGALGSGGVVVRGGRYRMGKRSCGRDG